MPRTIAPHGTSGRVTAVLGPTNTGKTHLAMERLLGHDSGMIGFPLRLLARENYDRAVAQKGRAAVALITGEEKIVPSAARYFMCTVESMPVARPVSFLAVDEVQLCADPDRGHLFTERLLNARGTAETMFMGAETIRPLLRRLVPEAEFVGRSRFSRLSYAGPRKIHRLPPRSAVVAFTAADVYAIAELIRRQRGGAAVVLGALSPRTRNAQVAMFQAGEVGYLVATDAIGMGLNMHVDHVAFAATRKFDGHHVRPLTPAELAQIAGRAGRHMNDGTFGTTADVDPLAPEVVDRIETHRFDALRRLYWRNGRLGFTSVSALRATLAAVPDTPGLVRAPIAEDEQALAALADDPDVAALADGPEAVRLLWDVCQIPDFRKVMSDAHSRLLGRIYRYLAVGGIGGGRLPTDWVATHVNAVDRTDGDIDALVQRIANVRTWTYVSYHRAWLDDAAHWQERTRGIEDRLSDALHDRLTQRFVDRRTALLVGRLRARDDLLAAVRSDGEVIVEGHKIGYLEGFLFVADRSGPADASAADTSVAARAISAAAARVLRGEIGSRVRRLEASDDKTLRLTVDGRVTWQGEQVGRLRPGPHILRPAVEALPSDLLEGHLRERVRVRLARWLDVHLRKRLGPLFALLDADVSGAARGLAFQLAEALGTLDRRTAAHQIDALRRADRRQLRGLDVLIGRESVYLPPPATRDAVGLRTLLWAIHAGRPAPSPPDPSTTSVPLDTAATAAYYAAIGFRVLGPRAVRVDIVERLSARAFARSRSGPFPAAADLMTLIGCDAEQLAGVLAGLGYRPVVTTDGMTFRRGGRRRQTTATTRPPADDNSPFAKLRGLGTR